MRILGGAVRAGIVTALLTATGLSGTGCGGSGGGGGGGSSGPLDLFVLDTANTIWHYAPGAPGTVIGSAPVTGLAAGELLVGIDADPATGQIYGLAVSGTGTGTDARLMLVNPLTGVATAVGTGLIVPVGTGDAGYGFDFIPTVNRIRVVNTADANFRIIPSNGTLGGMDVPINTEWPADRERGLRPERARRRAQRHDRLRHQRDRGQPDDPRRRQRFADPEHWNAAGRRPSRHADRLGVSVYLDIFGTNQAFAIFDGNTGPPVVNGLYTVNLTTGAATLVGTLAGGPALGSFGMALR